MFFRLAIASAALAALVPAAAGAVPTPVPGGANQVAAVSATLGQTVFNGILRMTVGPVHDATDAEVKAFLPNPDQKVMSFTALLRNGAKDDFIDLLSYSLADKDDVAVTIPSSDMHPGNVRILQAAAMRQTMVFAVDKDFVPVKLIVQCATCGARTAFRTVRFRIPSP